MNNRDNINFQTPEWVCNLMISLIPSDCLSILEPTSGNGNLVWALRKYRHFCIVAPKDFWKDSGVYYKTKWHWDCVIMNPPFSPSLLGYKFLFACMAKTNNIIALMPWWAIINSQFRTKQIVDWGLKEIYHLPRNAFPGARIQTCILVMQKGYLGFPILHLCDHWSEQEKRKNG